MSEWSYFELKRLFQLKHNGFGYPTISLILNRPSYECAHIYTHTDPDSVVLHPTTPQDESLEGTPWNERDTHILRSFVSDHTGSGSIPWISIARELKRSPETCENYYRSLSFPLPPTQNPPSYPPTGLYGQYVHPPHSQPIVRPPSPPPEPLQPRKPPADPSERFTISWLPDSVPNPDPTDTVDRYTHRPGNDDVSPYVRVPGGILILKGGPFLLLHRNTDKWVIPPFGLYLPPGQPPAVIPYEGWIARPYTDKHVMLIYHEYINTSVSKGLQIDTPYFNETQVRRKAAQALIKERNLR